MSVIFFNRFSRRVLIPPTRCIRYHQVPFDLIQKNSFRSNFQKKYNINNNIFDIVWNNNMKNYKLKRII